MATLQEVYNLRYEATGLRSRVTAAIAKAAQDVLNEDPGTTNHAERVVWANEALADTITWTQRMMWAVVGNATIQTNGESSSDVEVQNAVNGSIDTFATA